MKATSTRRRSKAQILEDKAAAIKKEKDIKEKLDQMEAMQNELTQLREMRGQAAGLHDMVNNMVLEGHLKQNPDGSMVAVTDPVEQESIRSQYHETKKKHAMTAVEAE